MLDHLKRDCCVECSVVEGNPCSVEGREPCPVRAEVAPRLADDCLGKVDTDVTPSRAEQNRRAVAFATAGVEDIVGRREALRGGLVRESVPVPADRVLRAPAGWEIPLARPTHRRNLERLCGAAERFVVIYSTDGEGRTARHVRHRPVARDVHERFPAFALMDGSVGIPPGAARFFMYERSTATR